MADQAEWIETASGAAGVATATKAAATGKSFIVDGVDASYAGAAEIWSCTPITRNSIPKGFSYH